MTTAVQQPLQDASRPLERWFYTVIAAEFLAIVVIGFAPNSIAIVEGTKANPPWIVHAHAAGMFSWMIGFLVQAYFISIGNVRQHIVAGRVLMSIGLCMALSFGYFSLFWPGEGFGRLQIPMAIERVGLFSLFLALAFSHRRKDSESHKRYILLATLVPLDAGLNRIEWLPAFGLAWATPPWVLLLLTQLLVFDWWKTGRLHKATMLGGGLIATYWLGVLLFLSIA